jgi:hypothetical protein
LKNKGFKEEKMTQVGLCAIGTSTTLESNKSLPLYSWIMTSTRARMEGRANPCRTRNQSITRAQRCRRAPSHSPSPRRRSHASSPPPVSHADGRTRATWPSAAASGCKHCSSTPHHRRRAHKWRGGAPPRPGCGRDASSHPAHLTPVDGCDGTGYPESQKHPSVRTSSCT